MKLLVLLVLVVPWEIPIICGIAYLTGRRWRHLFMPIKFIGYISPLSFPMLFTANFRNRGLIAGRSNRREISAVLEPIVTAPKDVEDCRPIVGDHEQGESSQ